VGALLTIKTHIASALPLVLIHVTIDVGGTLVVKGSGAVGEDVGAKLVAGEKLPVLPAL
jgi:hypothetical protein